MINTDDFIKRLEYLMEYYSLNASTFADKIGVQRSGISHLLSGRNKPSLDFVMKISDEFPEVNLYWLLDGKESFLKETTVGNTVTHSFENNAIQKNEEKESPEKSSPQNIIPDQKSSIPVIETTENIYKIIIFYNDGTFKDFAARP